MKRILCLLFILLIILPSCDNPPRYVPESKDNGWVYVHSDDEPVEYNVIEGENRLQYSDGYIFFENAFIINPIEPKENRTLMKYNVKNGNILSLCNDPVCLHNTDECPFFSMFSSMYVFDNNLMYGQQVFTTTPDGKPTFNYRKKLYNFDTEESILRESFYGTSSSEFIGALAIGKYIFYYDNVYDEEKDAWYEGVCRWDTVENNVEVIAGENNFYDADAKYPTALACRFIFAIDDRIYFTDNKNIFSTDVNFENRKEHGQGTFFLDVLTDGKYIYYGVPCDEDDIYLQSIYRMDLNGENVTSLDIVCRKGALKVTSGYLYYKNVDEIIIGKNRVSGLAGDNVVLQDSEIWRCRHDGTEKEMVYKFEGDMANYRIMYECYIGNYIYGMYSYWTDENGDGILRDGDHHYSDDNDRFDIIRIDMTTGDTYIINGVFE